MIHDAREVRQGTVQDSTLRSYSSEARGYVYFYLDRKDTGERILVKTDQIALEVYWKAPDEFKQRIVGLRDRKSLPTNIQYHLDHLVVVQDEFGDRIRIGDGDEVESVLHPVAPGSESAYDFLLADSVTLELPAIADTVRVYEIRVRPRDFDSPGFVGSLFLDRATGSIVRMSFTFTPASYVDDYLDHISISLENSLWMGRHWLPFRQSLEIRREVPFLDFPAGSVIRGSFQVRNYQINPPLPSTLFMGRTITAAPEAAREAFPFENDIFAQLDEEGLGGFRPPPEMDEIRTLALGIAKERYLSGLGRTRLFLPPPSVSSALRFNRAEGLFVGAGLSHALSPSLSLAGYAGLSTSTGRPTLEGRIAGGERHPGSGLHLFLRRPRDLGPIPAISGVLNTLSALVAGNDFTDLFFATGLETTHSFSPWPGGEVSLSARREKHRSARDQVSSDPENTRFRPVLAVDEGRWLSLEVTAATSTPWPNLHVQAGGLAGKLEGEAFGSLTGGLSFEKHWLTRGTDLHLDLRGGGLLGNPPIQAHYFLGGRGTVPGYPFRSRVGDRYWLLRAVGSVEILPPILRLRFIGSTAGIRTIEPDLPQALHSPGGWSRLSSLGLGLGLGWDVLRLDLARSLHDAGDWAVIVSVRPSFWPWL